MHLSKKEITLCQLFRSEKKDVEIWSKLKSERWSNYKLYINVCSVLSKLIFSWSGQMRSSVTERWEILEMLIFSAWFGNFVLEKKLLLNRYYYYYFMAVSLYATLNINYKRLIYATWIIKFAYAFVNGQSRLKKWRKMTTTRSLVSILLLLSTVILFLTSKYLFNEMMW